MILMCFLAARYLTNISHVAFHPDESHWIATSRVFEKYFSAQFNSPLFDESYWTLTQPPLARYVIGLGRRIGGYAPSELNRHWVYSTNAEENIQRGAMPSDNLLWWSRLPMAILALFSLYIGFVLVKSSADFLAGVFWIIICSYSSYLLLTLRRAMGESPLLFFIVLEAYICYRFLAMLKTEEPIKPWKFLMWSCSLGAIAGAAGAAKLNGLSAVLPGMVLAIIAAAKLGRSIRKKLLWGFLAVSVVVFSASSTFVGLNPYLWPDPVARTHRMIDHRIKEMNNQKERFSESRIDGLGERWRVIPTRLFQDYSAMTFKYALIINMICFMVGLLYILRKLWRAVVRRSIEPAPMAMLLVGICVAVPPLFTPLDRDRYFLFPEFFSTFFIAVGLALAGEAAYGRLKVGYARWLTRNQR